MTATRDNIFDWLMNKNYPLRKSNATHMLVVCDTYDYEDYPIFVGADEDVHTVIRKFSDNMQKVMEVYNLSLPIIPQTREYRAWNI